MKFFLNIIVISFLASGCSSFSKKDYDQIKYSIVKSEDNIEIRQYEKYLAAETYVEGDRKKAPDKAFKILLDYISGDNVQKKNISMTAPVTMVERKMNFWSMTFMMPENFTLQSLPKPNSDKVSFKMVPERKIAAIIFSGNWSESNFRAKTKELLAYLKKHGYKINSQEINTFYNSPFTFPWSRRNEIMFEVQ